MDIYNEIQQKNEELIKDLKQFLNEWDEDDYVSKSIKLILNQIVRHSNAIEEMLFNTLKYKKMWEELYSENEKPCSIEYMQDLEDKYKIEV